MPPLVKFRTVAGFPDYKVGDNGSIYSIKFKKSIQLKVSLVRGYCQVCLYRNGEKCLRKLHRIVLETFVGAPPNAGDECCHNNGVPTDNRLCNLRWGSRKANMADQTAHNTRIKGDTHPRSKLTEKQVLEIRRRYAAGGVSQQALGTEFGVKQAAIGKIVLRKLWQHV